MASCDLQVGQGSDDGYENENSGSVVITASTLWLASSTNASARIWGVCRFCGSLPPKGATISVAYTSVYGAHATYNNANVDIYAEDGAGPTTLTTATGDITDRTRTTASTAWAADSVGTGWVQSPSLVSVIQELVNDYAVTAIALIFKPRTDTVKLFQIRQQNFTGNAHGVKLHLEWTAVGEGKVHRVHRSNLRKRAGRAA